MAEYIFDPEFGSQVINETDVDTAAVFRALSVESPEVAELVRWSSDMRMPASRSGGLFERDVYVTPHTIFQQMRVAQMAAAEDDVVSGIVDSTEALAFSKMSIDSEDDDEADIWNQIAEDVELDTRMREMWREDFIVSQFYCAVWWGQKSYKVRGKTDAGITRKKKFDNIRVPLGLSLLDPLKVVPVGNFLFNQEQLCYVADIGEYDMIRAVIDGRRSDPMIEQMIVAQYEPDDVERRMLSEDDIAVGRMFLLNPANVWRHTETRGQYKRYADVRMKSVFELLDLKRQLRAMDRAVLLGGTNFIVLVKKGSKDRPAKPAELENLNSQVRTLARVPVLVGDDRLSVEIITPKTDTVLQPERYNGIDSRITSRLFQMFNTGNFASGAKGDDSVKLAKIVARGLESRRLLIKRSFEKYILAPTFRKNESFTSKPNLLFHPKRIALDFDPTFANYLLDLYDRGPVAIETVLEEIDVDIRAEVRRRTSEEKIKKILAPRPLPPTATNPEDPFSLPPDTSTPGPANTGGGKADPKSAGRAGGRRGGGVKNGGGAAPGSGQGQPPRDARNLSDDK